MMIHPAECLLIHLFLSEQHLSLPQARLIEYRCTFVETASTH
jgi:hypothetical protein